MKKFILINILIYCYFTNYHAKALDINKWILSAENDDYLKNHSEWASYFDKIPAQKSIINLKKIEFRTEFNEFDLSKQKYAFRFYPKTKDEISSNEHLLKILKKQIAAEHNLIFSQVLYKRYKLMIEYFETLSLHDIKNKLLVIYDDRVQVLKKKWINNMTMDINSLVSSEDNYNKLFIELMNIDNKIKNIAAQMKQIANCSEINFDMNLCINPEEIESWLISFQKDSIYENADLNYQKSNTELAQKKYEIDFVKDKSFINFISIDYNSDQYRHFDKSFSMEFAFILPFFQDNFDNTIKSKRKYLREKYKYQEEKIAFYEQINAVSDSLNNQILKYYEFINRNNEIQSDLSFEKYMNIEGADPLTLLKIKESFITKDLFIHNFSWAIRKQFIELIYLSGKLSEKPLRNYLSNKIEVIL